MYFQNAGTNVGWKEHCRKERNQRLVAQFFTKLIYYGLLPFQIYYPHIFFVSVNVYYGV